MHGTFCFMMHLLVSRNLIHTFSYDTIVSRYEIIFCSLVNWLILDSFKTSPDMTSLLSNQDGCVKAAL